MFDVRADLWHAYCSYYFVTLHPWKRTLSASDSGPTPRRAKSDFLLELASLVAGAAHAGEVFAELSCNEADYTYKLVSLQALAFQRVLVIAGPSTCSAAELLINGLAPFVNVVTIGAATCGKPVGVEVPAY